jgi:acetyl-CoA decarbonylase/synthase complex subunit gamma
VEPGPAFVTGELSAAGRSVPRVGWGLSWADRAGALKVRSNIGRASYSVPPGLYALGDPDRSSPVLVSANYKLSFDVLRSSVPGVNAWILVLDTAGINVWCAAGKGTFGTEELARRVQAVGLADVVDHRKLVVPQLGAPGVAAHEVKRRTGFRVVYGPVRASDLPAFLRDRMKAPPEARRVRFDLADRVKLIPVELVQATQIALGLAALVLLVSGIGRGGYSLDRVADLGLPAAASLLLTTIASSVLTPTLLPWLPGRAFALKGLWIGLAAGAGVLLYAHARPELWLARPVTLGWALALPPLASFVAMGFTGASTYTSLSGVLREMRVALPIQIGTAVVAVALWLGGSFL